MIVCTVHEPADPPADRIERAVALQFVRDGFSPAAAVLAPLWLIGQRAWPPLIGYALAVAAVWALVEVTGARNAWLVLAIVAIHVVVGFEAASIRRLALEARGWHTLGAVAGRNAEECERRFLDGWLAGKSVLPDSGSNLPATGLSGLADAAASRLARWRPWRRSGA